MREGDPEAVRVTRRAGNHPKSSARVRRRSSFEKIKKLLVLDRDFELEKGETTPSLKVKRNIVEKKHGDQIAALYGEDKFDSQI